MNAIGNGIALHGGFIPYTGTFLMFSEYGRNALRMAALMGQRVISVFTHDSIGLGEDGPTHQAVEQTATLRLMPNMSVWRPCDAVESMVAWKAAIERRDGPTSLLFSRQGLPHQHRTPRADSGNRARGVRAARRNRRAPHRHRLGGRNRDGCCRPSRRPRHRGAGRLDAQHRCVRGAGRRVSRIRAPAIDAGAGGSGSRSHRRLARLGRRGRRRSRGSTRSGSPPRTSTSTNTSA